MLYCFMSDEFSFLLIISDIEQSVVHSLDSLDYKCSLHVRILK